MVQGENERREDEHTQTKSQECLMFCVLRELPTNTELVTTSPKEWKETEKIGIFSFFIKAQFSITLLCKPRKEC